MFSFIILHKTLYPSFTLHKKRLLTYYINLFMNIRLQSRAFQKN